MYAMYSTLCNPQLKALPMVAGKNSSFIVVGSVHMILFYRLISVYTWNLFLHG